MFSITKLPMSADCAVVRCQAGNWYPLAARQQAPRGPHVMPVDCIYLRDHGIYNNMCTLH
jgi:hypothetical protein